MVSSSGSIATIRGFTKRDVVESYPAVADPLAGAIGDRPAVGRRRRSR
jgi:hypothetical protein